MKILMLTHEFSPYPGGIGRYCHELASAAVRRGHKVHVLAPDYRTHHQDDPKLGFAITRFKGSVFVKRDFSRIVFQLWKMLRQEKWDIIHAADWPFIIACRLLSRIYPFRYICTAYGTEVAIIRDGNFAKFLMATDAYAKASAVACISNFTRDLLQQKNQGLGNEVRLTYLGVNDFWHEQVSANAIAQMRQNLDIESSRLVISCVARIDYRKGQLNLAKALALLPESLKQKISLLIVGRVVDEEYYRLIQNTCSASDVDVRFLHGLSDIDARTVLACSDLFCLPGSQANNDGRVEGFGLAYVEASAQGVPQIGPGIWAVPEVVLDGVTGKLVTPDDIEGLCSAIASIFEDAEHLSELSRNSLLHSQRFTWDECARATYEDTPQQHLSAS